MKYEAIEKNEHPLAEKIEYHTAGSGLNYSYEWSIKGNILRLQTFYQNMNDAGYYTGSTPVCIWFNMSGKEIDFKIRCDNGNGLREYLEDLFYNAVNA